MILENDTIDIVGLAELAPGKQVKIILNHAGGEKETIWANHSYNNAQVEWFRAGSALNLIRNKNKM
jgi:aconitate hydratase